MKELYDVKDESWYEFLPEQQVIVITPHEIDDETIDKLEPGLRNVFRILKNAGITNNMQTFLENEKGIQIDRESLMVVNAILGTTFKINEEEEEINMYEPFEELKRAEREEG